MGTRKSGISLIVLVITIIVMIILAAAIILSISNSGIMDKANKAKEDSDAANLKEYVNVLEAEWELGVAEASSQTKTEYINTKLAEKGYNRKVTEEGVLLTESATKAIDAGIQIGDVVKYEVTSKTEPSKSTDTGYMDQNMSNQTDLTWRYIGISDNGEIMIAPDVTSNASKMFFVGSTGYLKGPAELNRLCDVLYSTKKGTARSMTIEDVNNLLGYTGEKGSYVDASGETVETAKVLTIAELEKELGKTLSNRTTPDGTDIGTYESDKYTISKDADVSKMKSPEHRNLVFYSSSYWLASTCSYPAFIIDVGIWSVRHVSSSGVHETGVLTSEPMSHGYEDGSDKSIRPVVLLKSDVMLQEETTDVWILS